MDQKKPVVKDTGDNIFLLRLKDFLNKYSESFIWEIDYNHYDKDEGLIRIIGWAVFYNDSYGPSRTVDIDVLLRKDLSVESFKTILREDVNQIYGLPPEAEAGFELVLKVPRGKKVPTIYLVLDDKETGIKAPVLAEKSNHHVFDAYSGWEYYKKLYQEEGLKAALDQFKIQKMQKWDSYNYWFYDQRIKNPEEILQDISTFEKKPKISIVVPVYDLKESYLRQMIESVRGQLYENWELILSDDNSPAEHVKRVLSEYAAKDPRIKVVFRSENGHISEATNSALNIATGDYIGFLDHDDELAPNTLYEYVKLINQKDDADLIYSDQDNLTFDNVHTNPFFKSGWNPRLLLSHNYVSHFLLVKRDVYEKAGQLRSSYNGSQDYDFFLRALPHAEGIYHIPKILYSWRMVEGSVAEDPQAKNYAYLTGQKAIEDYIAKNKRPAKVSIGNEYGTYKIEREDDPSVTLIIVADKNKKKSEETLRDLMERTDYPNYNILAVNFELEVPSAFSDRVEYIWNNKPMSKNELLNYAAKKATGEYLGFIRPGTRPLHPDWLQKLVNETFDPETGIIGGTIVDKNEEVLNAGMAFDVPSDKIVYPYVGTNRLLDSLGYYFRLSLPQNVMAVSSVCFLISKELFEEIGGFNDFNSPLQEIDLSLRALEKGKRTVFAPQADFMWTGKVMETELRNPKKGKLYYYKNPLPEEKEKLLKKYTQEDLKDIYTNDMIQRFRRSQDSRYTGLPEDAHV